MNRRLKNALQASFDAPMPTDRERFLKTLRYPKLTYSQFMYSQFCYIRKRLWALSFLLLLIGWAIASPTLTFWRTEFGAIRVISTFLPFLALLTVTELYRSSSYHMAELEAVCRYSLSQIVMARITILGGGNSLILLLLMIFMTQASAYSLLQIVTYVMVPYLITCGACLLILNRMRSRDSVYACAATTCLMCITNIIISSTLQQLYSNVYLNIWLLMFVLSGIFIGIQIRTLLKRMEDRTWNLLLND